MYSHLSASVAAERTDDDLYRAHLRRLARDASTPARLPTTAELLGREPRRAVRVRWRRRAARQQPRPVRA